MDTCTISTCGRTIPQWDQPRYACTGCAQRAAQQLADLPGDYLLLDPTPGRSGPAIGSCHATAGSRPPLDLAVVDLTGRRGVLVALTGWAGDWAEQRDEPAPDWPDGERAQIAVACGYLRWHLDWAARHHPAVDEALAEIGAAYRQVHAAATGERGERAVRVLCPCGARLAVTVSTHRATCADCQRHYGRADALALPLAPRTAA